MTGHRPYRGHLLLVLLLLLGLAWPTAPVLSATTHGLAAPGDAVNCASCCIDCHDGNILAASCYGTAAGCSGLVAINPSFRFAPPAMRTTPPATVVTPFTGWVPEPDGHPPKSASSV